MGGHDVRANVGGQSIKIGMIWLNKWTAIK